MTNETEAPERIWAAPNPTWADAVAGDWPSPTNPHDTEYTRKDLTDAKDKRITELEEKLAKAVEISLEECPFQYGSGSYNEWWQNRRTTLAELKGTR